MRTLFLVAAAALVVGAACSSAPAAVTTTKAGSDECSVLSAQAIQSVTGTSVRGVARGAFVGAGGTCANYVDGAGAPYLGVNRLVSKAEYSRSLAAVPEGIYPVRQSLGGVGDEAILFADAASNPHLRYLVAHAGERGVVIFPFSGSNITDDQLRELASAALMQS